jgi:ribosome-binding factor A
MSSTRQQKIARVLKEELSRIFREEMNDPRLGFLSITDITVTPDLRTAHVYVSVFGTPEEQEESIAALEHARGYLRSTLGKEINMRYTPELDFHLDRSIERGARIFELLKEIETEEGGEKGSGEKNEK